MMPAERMKNALARGVMQAFPLEQLPDCRIVGNANEIAADLDLKMQIPDHPRDAQLFLHRRAASDYLQLQNPFGLLRNAIALLLAFEKRRAIRERLIEIKSELDAVFGNATPATFGQREAIDMEPDFAKARSRFAQCAADDFHVLKKEIALRQR